MFTFIKFTLIFLCVATCQSQTAVSNWIISFNCSSDPKCENLIAQITSQIEQTYEESIQSGQFSGDQPPTLRFTDIDECSRTMSYCSNDAKCINTYSSYRCECNDGFDVGNFTGVDCVDVDECDDPSLNNCTSDEECINFNGSYGCVCLINGTSMGSRCEIIDEVLNTTQETTTLSTSTIQSTNEPSQLTAQITQATTPIPQSATPTTQATTKTTQSTTQETTQETTKTTQLAETTQTSTQTAQATTSTMQLATQSTTQTTQLAETTQTTTQATQETTPTTQPTTQSITQTTQLAIETTQTSTQATQETTPTMQPTTQSTISTMQLTTQSTTDMTQSTTKITQIVTEPMQSTNEVTQSTTLITQSTVDITQSTNESILTTAETTQPTTSTTSLPMKTAQSSSVIVDSTAQITTPLLDIDASDITNGISDDDAIRVVEDLSALINQGPVNEDTAETIVNVFELFASSEVTYGAEVSSEITQLLDDMLNSMTLINGQFEFQTDSIAVAAIDIDSGRSTELPYSIESGLGNVSSSAGFSPMIVLPPLLFNDLDGSRAQRISFTGYSNAKLFQSSTATSITNTSFTFDDVSSSEVINSAVIGSSLNGTTVQNLDSPVRVSLPTILREVADEVRSNMTSVRRALYNPTCVFFNKNLSNGLGDWSTEGCVRRTSSVDTNVIVCECNHLTSFAVLMSVETSVDDQVLNILAYVGCSLSILGLIISIVTYSLFRHLRKHKSKQILIYFCISLLGVYLVYLFGIAARFPSNQSQCIASGFFLHYFTAATFAWMLVQVIDMYLMFVKVWSEISNPVKKASLFAWGFPLLLAVSTLIAHFSLQAVYPESESMRLYPVYRATTVCWLSTLGLYWAFFLPLGIILTINLIFFLIVIYHVTWKRSSSQLTRAHSTRKKIKVGQHVFNATAILLLSGPTWIIGFLINLDPISDGVTRRILAYIFVFLNAFQGLWIFFVFTVRPKAVKAAWTGLLSGKSGLRQPSKSGSWRRRTTKTTSSSYISRLYRRKSSADVRRSSTSSGANAFKINSTGKLREIEEQHQVAKESGNTKLYRYTATPRGSDDATNSNPDSKEQENSSASNANLVLEGSADNPTFNADEGSSPSSSQSAT